MWLMSNKNLIPAFTIVEAVVSMAVTAIIISVIFVIFSVTSQRLLDLKSQSQYINDLNRMTYSINKGIFDSERMDVTESGLLFTGYNGDITEYKLSEKYFVRKQNDFTDTFNLIVKNIKIDTLESAAKKVKFQRVKWNIKINDKETQLSFYKKIYTNDLIKSMYKNEY